MEVFTFLRMGGARERIVVSMITSPGEDPTEAKTKLKKQFAEFDAAKAECFLAKDKHRLLAVVEAGFGDFKMFNERVRSIFDDRLHEACAKTLVPKAQVQPEEKAGASEVEVFDLTSGAALASSAAPATAKVAPA